MVYYEESQFVPSSNNDWILATTAEMSLVSTEEQEQVEEEDENGAESDYSLDYEYLGPRRPNYRNEQDADSDASELSCSSSCHEGFDMWDEDPYSTNDFTWESNDMRLTGFIKARQKELDKINTIAPWNNSTFWRKQKGWPKQLPSSSSTTNHDQSANALSLILSDYGLSEKLHAVYRDRIVECGKFINNSTATTSATTAPSTTTTTSTSNMDNINTKTSSNNETTWLDNYEPGSSSSTNNNDNNTMTTTITSNKFNETHASVSLPRTVQEQQQLQQQEQCLHDKNMNNSSSIADNSNNNNNFLSKFTPYTKYIRRSQFPVIFPQDAYLALGFEPLCLAEKYGYMAIGGVEGEFELYCCMDQNKPVKIWGTKFKGKNNVLLMTNAVQIVRWKKTKQLSDDSNHNDYNYFLIACMNDAGVLIYDLPSHHHCNSATTTTTVNCHLHCHIRCFDHVPINDARVSPNGQHLVCVGDDACIFHLTVSFNEQKNRLVFGTPQKIKIPPTVLLSTSDSLTFSSQYVAWSKSSLFFAHTSDTHNTVFIWRTKPKFEMLYQIDAGGYTYAIQFHPEQEGVLAFSNRYGYLHTVNLDEAVTREEPNRIIRVSNYDRQTITENGHACVPYCQSGQDAIHHTFHILARHEITMVSFRGEKNRRLRILAKINGLQWSRDGCYLYVSTKKRVLAYEFMQSSCHIKSLEKMAGIEALTILEEEEQKKKRKRQTQESVEKRRKRKIWCEKWSTMPAHVRHNVLGDTNLASHW